MQTSFIAIFFTFIAIFFALGIFALGIFIGWNLRKDLESKEDRFDHFL
jgi:hypothetical protein